MRELLSFFFNSHFSTSLVCMYDLNSSSSKKKLEASYSHLMGPMNDQKALLLQAHVQIFCQFLFMSPKSKY